MERKDLAFGKLNYILIGVSVLIIITGFALMTGSSVMEGEPFNYDIFSTRRIVVAPVVCLSGFVLMIFAILKDTKSKKKTN